MKLDVACVREILLYLESDPSTITNENGAVEVVGTWFEQICENLPNYSPETIYYTLARLEEGGYVSLSTQWAGNGLNMCCVNYITYSGHEFLEKIRPDTVWKTTTNIAGKVGSFGLQMIEKIAEGVATAYINKLISGG